MSDGWSLISVFNIVTACVFFPSSGTLPVFQELSNISINASEFPQNHSMTEVGKDLWKPPAPIFLLKHGHLEPVALDHVQMSSEDLKRGRPHNLFGWPVPVLSHLHSKMLLGVRCSDWNCKFALIASSPVTGHHCKEHASILFMPSLQVLVHIDKIPLSLCFPRLNCSSSLTLSSYMRCSSSLITLVTLC